jgi:hypothetical protein
MSQKHTYNQWQNLAINDAFRNRSNFFCVGVPSVYEYDENDESKEKKTLVEQGYILQFRRNDDWGATVDVAQRFIFTDPTWSKDGTSYPGNLSRLPILSLFPLCTNLVRITFY